MTNLFDEYPELEPLIRAALEGNTENLKIYVGILADTMEHKGGGDHAVYLRRILAMVPQVVILPTMRNEVEE